LETLVTHCNRVARYALQTFDGNKELFIAGLLHDVGKVEIPVSILKKKGPLTNYEYEVIKEHPQKGANLLNKLSYSEEIVVAILCHHEKWDGTGYPYGLTGENIPLFSRILAVADAYDAMTSYRPYRRKLTVDEALQEIEINAGTQFDPHIVELFLHRLKRNCNENKRVSTGFGNNGYNNATDGWNRSFKGDKNA